VDVATDADGSMAEAADADGISPGGLMNDVHVRRHHVVSYCCAAAVLLHLHLHVN